MVEKKEITEAEATRLWEEHLLAEPADKFSEENRRWLQRGTELYVLLDSFKPHDFYWQEGR